MKNLILIDGNNLMFRSYYATAYTGNLMKNSQGFPTNALYGFITMLNKIIMEEKPEYMLVAFDVGKNFRKEEYDFYKEGRIGMPEELKMQMPVARVILDNMGIKHLELEPYEADDIIGTIVKYTEADKDFKSIIVSSDKDLLQLISDETEVKLLKQVGHIRYNHAEFLKDYGIEPIRMIDLKALMGDSSDNIPGVKGIGEKTALKLLQTYESIENLYDHIDSITGKTQEKLIMGKDSAFMSKKIATIYRDVPLNISLNDLKYDDNYPKDALIKQFKELEFFSILKNMEEKSTKKELFFKIIDNLDDLILENDLALYLELDEENYHKAKMVALALSDAKNNYFIPNDLIIPCLEKIKDKNIWTYDLKKVMCNTKVKLNCSFDLMIASYLLNYVVKDDIAYLTNQFQANLAFYDNLKKNKFKDPDFPNEMILRSRFIYDQKDFFMNKLKETKTDDLFYQIEMPLVEVLANMEQNGIKVDLDILREMQKELEVKIELLTEEIYNCAGIKFNISSPRQLGEVLFDFLELGKGKKNKTGYKTDVKVLEKLIDKHPVVEKILTYRNLTKLKSTYLDGLESYVLSDQKIHTIYKQTLTRTGRLSSVEPNLQNIPVREELGRSIRKAFKPCYDYLLSADYSQIELRILAHLTGCTGLKEAFLHDQDIHRSVASQIYNIKEEDVTSSMRRTAKAVIFGIVYGISGFGLGENLHIQKQDADLFIKKFYELYPEVKNYMDETINKAYETGEVATLFGRIRVIEELKNPNYLIRQMGERMAMNTPIQGTSADIMKMAMINVYQRFKKENIQSKILLQVHDEIIVDCLKEELDQVQKIIKEEMENVYPLDVPLKVEIGIGSNWYEAK